MAAVARSRAELAVRSMPDRCIKVVAGVAIPGSLRPCTGPAATSGPSGGCGGGPGCGCEPGCAVRACLRLRPGQLASASPAAPSSPDAAVNRRAGAAPRAVPEWLLWPAGLRRALWRRSSPCGRPTLPRRLRPRMHWLRWRALLERMAQRPAALLRSMHPLRRLGWPSSDAEWSGDHAPVVLVGLLGRPSRAQRFAEKSCGSTARTRWPPLALIRASGARRLDT